jgi:hypothetical protein
MAFVIISLASHSVKTISHNCLEMKPRGAG